MASKKIVKSIKLSDAKIADYHEFGYLHIANFLCKSALPLIKEEIYEVLKLRRGITKQDLSQANCAADRLRQCEDYLEGSGLDALINSQETLSVASQLIGGQAIRYLPFTAVKACGGGVFDFHQDNNYTVHEPALGSLNIWVALVDMSIGNGCLKIVPSSHKLGQLESIKVEADEHRKILFSPDQFSSMEVKAGDAVAFTRLTVHGSGPNETHDPRIAYALQYHRDDIKYFDNIKQCWKLLIDEPRFQTPPLKQL